MAIETMPVNERHAAQISDPDRRLLCEQEISELYGIPRATLQQMRFHGRGPLFLKLGRSVRYRVADIDAWLSCCRRASTSASGPPEAPRR